MDGNVRNQIVEAERRLVSDGRLELMKTCKQEILEYKISVRANKDIEVDKLHISKDTMECVKKKNKLLKDVAIKKFVDDTVYNLLFKDGYTLK